MSVSSTINITRELSMISNNIPDYSLLRIALREALEDNFYDIAKRLQITTISDINYDTADNILISVSEDENVVTINKVTSNKTLIPLSTINYVPYISYVKYSQYVSIDSSGFSDTENKYRPVATILLNVVIDKNICGFSILSPADIQLSDVENNIYTIKNNINSIQSSIMSEADEAENTIPDVIKLQSSLIYDKNSYYEIQYSDINDPYTINIVPCINSIVYFNNNIYSFETLFSSLSVNFDSSEDESIIGNIFMNSKLLSASSVTTENTIINSDIIHGYSTTIFDCPSLDVPDNWTQNSNFNIGESITIGNSDYLISDKNTLIQLDNTEIYGVNQSVIYDGKPHMFNLIYPKAEGNSAWFRLASDSETVWREFPDDITTIKDFVEAQQYIFDYRVDIKTQNDIKSYYGSVELNILPANQFGYLVKPFLGSYDALPHTLYIYTDALAEYSLDSINWSSTPPTFIEPGTYTIYYRLSQANYNTVIDSVNIIIYPNTNTDSLEFGIDVSSNIIVMRQQLYSRVNSDLYLLPTDNRIYLSTELPTIINVNEFTGKFPNPTNTIATTEILGTFKVSPFDYYMLLECYLPWYYDGQEPTRSNPANLDQMLGDTVTFTIEYTNVSDPTENDWIVLESDIAPSNAFYQYRVTNISKPFTRTVGTDSIPVGSLWGDSSKNQYSVKRAVVNLPLNAKLTGTNIKTIRIKCTHTSDVIGYANADPSKSYIYPYYEYGTKITSQYLGISLITLNEYITPGTVKYNNVTIYGDIYQQIPLTFKSSLTSNAFFSYNTGDNLQYSGCGELNYDTFTYNSKTFKGIDPITGIFEGQAYIMWRNGDSVSASGSMAQNWLANNYFTILKNQLCKIQFNSDKLIDTDNNFVTLTNTDKIYAYIPCNTRNGGG